MSSPFGAKSLAVLHYLNRNEPKNRLELEREMAIAPLDSIISKLRQGGYIKSVPKKPGELQRYAITQEGRRVIGAHHQRQHSLRHRPLSELPAYVPPADPYVRPGAMDAYSLPSRGMR